MNTYLVLLRGINVGGRNKVSMSILRQKLEEAGFKGVKTYIQSGNIILSTDYDKNTVSFKIGKLLAKSFDLDKPVLVLTLEYKQLKSVIDKAPRRYGRSPEKYKSDVAFLIDVDPKDIKDQFKINPLVDQLWAGEGVIYYQRLSENLSKSRIASIMSNPVYKKMTIRNWRTTTKLLEMMEEVTKDLPAK